MQSYDAYCNLEYQRDHHPREHIKENFIIRLSYAVIKPRAMMIKVRNASITLLAMLSSLLNMCFTYVAVVFININVKFHHVISTNLGFSLKVHRNISGVYYCCLKCINTQDDDENTIYASRNSC